MRTVVVKKGAMLTELAIPPRIKTAEFDIVTILEPEPQPRRVSGRTFYSIRLGKSRWLVDLNDVRPLYEEK